MVKKSRLLPVCLLFFGSGSVGLIYEVAWARQLQLLFGSTVFSISTILAAFFSGMALGSYIMGRWGNLGSPVRIYGILEICVGLYVLAMPLLLGLVDKAYLDIAPIFINRFLAAQAVKFLLCFSVLVIPCTLMGGTLPVLSRALIRDPENTGSSAGILYSVNTLGAVAGAGIAGFYLIQRFGIFAVVLGGGTLSIIIGLLALFISFVFKEPGKGSESVQRCNRSSDHDWVPAAFYGVSGFCALSYEILWTRSLLQTFVSSTYAFTAVLMIYLLGLGAGSNFASIFVKRIKNPGAWFAGLQTGLGITVFCGMILLPKISMWHDALTLEKGLIMSMILTAGILLLLPCFFMGAMFPLVAAWAAGEREAGHTVGRIYSANTVGAILGSLCTSFLLIPLMGIRCSMIVLVAANMVVGVAVFRFKMKDGNIPGVRILSAGTVLFLVIMPFVTPQKIFTPAMGRDFRPLYYNEGIVANVSVWQCTAPGRDFKVLKMNRVLQSGGTDRHGLMVQRRQGHLPMLLHRNPQSVLVIGLATGVTLASAAEHNARHLDCVEIVPSQLDAVKFFSKENGNVRDDPRVRVIIDDGRSFLRTTRTRYDVIIGDLFQVQSAGTGNLYAVDHVETCRDRLKPGGIMVQWFPLQQLRESDFKSAVRSFTTVFEHVQLWFCDTSPEKPVMALVASMEPMRLELDLIKKRIVQSKSRTLSSTGYDDPFLLISHCIMQTQSVKEYAGKAPLNTYDHPVIEFSAPFAEKAGAGMEIISGLMKIKPALRLEAESDEDLETMVKYSGIHFKNLVSQIAGVKGRWSESEMILEQAIREAPDNFDVRRLLGRTKVVLASGLVQRGEPEMALRKLDSALIMGIDDVYLFNLIREAKDMRRKKAAFQDGVE
jgi:spermidine synthase